VLAVISSPIAPFYSDKLYCDLEGTRNLKKVNSVHLTSFPEFEEKEINKDLEERMWLAQKISSMILGLRRKVNIKVRQPLNKIIIPILEKGFIRKLDGVKNLILSEVNVKELEYIDDTSSILLKKIKPNFKILGPRYGKLMKKISDEINKLNQEDILNFEKNGKFEIDTEEQKILIGLEDVEIISEDIPGWLVANENNLTVALDIKVTEELKNEGIARELVNRIQNLRKESGFDVTDKILIEIQKHPAINTAIEQHTNYIASQTLAKSIELKKKLNGKYSSKVEIDEELSTLINIIKIK